MRGADPSAGENEMTDETTDSEEELRCPLCGHVFSEKDVQCHTGCPFAEGCRVACCPSCGYRLIRESKTVKWLRRILRRS